MKEYYVGSDRVNLLHEINRPSMVSAYTLRDRKADIIIKKDQRWMMDSGAFTQVTKFGDFTISPEKYMRIATRFQNSGALACIVTQDYMCEPDVINKLQENGREASVRIHQRKTIERYIQIVDEAHKQGLQVPVMPVLQGWEVEDYVDHFHLYRRMLRDESINRPWIDRFGNEVRNQQGLWSHAFDKHTPIPGWIGIGSTCKRNKNPEIVSEILDAVVPLLLSAKIHLFGFKKTGLRLASIRDRVYSADSFAYDFADRMDGLPRDSKTRTKSATKFHDEITNQPVQECLQLT